jgi:transcriptional regulator with XRE-family HTH domain
VAAFGVLARRKLVVLVDGSWVWLRHRDERQAAAQKEFPEWPRVFDQRRLLRKSRKEVADAAGMSVRSWRWLEAHPSVIPHAEQVTRVLAALYLPESYLQGAADYGPRLTERRLRYFYDHDLAHEWSLSEVLDQGHEMRRDILALIEEQLRADPEHRGDRDD